MGHMALIEVGVRAQVRRRVTGFKEIVLTAFAIAPAQAKPKPGQGSGMGQFNSAKTGLGNGAKKWVWSVSHVIQHPLTTRTGPQHFSRPRSDEWWLPRSPDGVATFSL